MTIETLPCGCERRADYANGVKYCEEHLAELEAEAEYLSAISEANNDSVYEG